MTRQEIFQAIEAERAYQIEKWGDVYDDSAWTAHDWVAFITKYAARAVGVDATAVSQEQFRVAMTKVAALAVAALEVN